MAVDIFNNKQTHKPTAFKTIDTAVLKVSGVGGDEIEEYLIQSFAFNYASDVSQIFEIGSENTYTLPARSRGQFQIGRIVGRKNITEVLGDFETGVWSSNNCDEVTSITFTITNNCDTDAGSLGYDLSGVVINNYGISSNANQLVIQENVSGIFTSLKSYGTG